MRKRRSAAITWTRASSVRLWTRFGADERSSSPARPSALKRRTHSPARRSLTSAAAAASVSDQLSSTIRENEQLALLQAERGVTVELHSVSSLGLSGVSTSQPPRRPG
jgi:hypothetical protein